MSVANGLTREKLQQLLAACARGGDSTKVEAAEHQWHKPNCFAAPQLKKLQRFAAQLAGCIGSEFTEFYRRSFEAAAVSISQYFAESLLAQAAREEQGFYYLAFCDEKTRWQGFVGIPPQTARVWATRLLGGTGSAADASVRLTQLEESLLRDAVNLIVTELSRTNTAFNFLAAEDFIQGRLPIELAENEELCRLAFDIKESDSEPALQAYIVLPCSALGPVAGEGAKKQTFTTEQVSNAVLQHIHDVPVCVTARLASTTLTLEELMNLQSGDVLLLDRKVDEAIEVVTDGRTVLYGRPVKSSGKYAVVVTERSE